ncbi:MAG: hypothetical protein KF861_08125 [Planctomycetaceae bacterium]|nr:hypothetical protein [Planctomycetaceae bacterium]
MTIRLASCSWHARRAAVLPALAVAVWLGVSTAIGGESNVHRSANFVVKASSRPTAQKIAQAAEEYRLQFATDWLNQEVPEWESPCHITVDERATGGEGWFSYETSRGSAPNLQIVVQGRLDRIVEYVLPHEVAHAMLCTALAGPLPRWADEGVALLSESESQRVRQQKTFAQLASAGSVMPLSDILQVVDYPAERRELIGYYAACYSLTEYLVAHGGRQRMLQFVADGDRHGWEDSVRRHYGLDLAGLETAWRSSNHGNGRMEVASLPDVAVPKVSPAE